MTDITKTEKWAELQSARYHLTQAAENAIAAQSLHGANESHRRVHEEWMHNSLAKAADALGYIITKREQEAA